MPETLSGRQLNRATLARQWMLERAAVSVPHAIPPAHPGRGG